MTNKQYFKSNGNRSLIIPTGQSRFWTQAAAVVLVMMIFIVPILLIVLGSLSKSWSKSIPDELTIMNYNQVLNESDTLSSIRASIITAMFATIVALILAIIIAISSRSSRLLKRISDIVFLLPLTIPSVVIGLAVLMTFSEQPLALNGTMWIVLIGHSILVCAFSYQSLSAAVGKLDLTLEEAASALGASNKRVFFTVTLPQLKQAILGTAGLCIALSLGELTVTTMVAPPQWQTIPLQIFSYTSRGLRMYEGAALSIVLLILSVSILIFINWILGQTRRGRVVNLIPKFFR